MAAPRPRPAKAGTPDRRGATLAPFQHRIFLAVWLASLFSNFGSMIQAVGASWLMTSIAPSADMVALVQASTALPIMLFSLPAGAIADVADRRIVMLIAQGFMLAVSATLAVVALTGAITPWLLLSMTFLIGCGAALNGPAWQSSVGEQVPRPVLPAAVALNTVGFNLARTLGPAIGGLLVASAGPQAAFMVNAVTYVGLIVVLARWRRPAPARSLPPERIGAAMGAGLRYASLSPVVRKVLIRTSVFGLLGSAVWALMPLVARDLIGGGPLVYGLLLGAFGAGAVAGALVSMRLRQRYAPEALVRGGIAAFAAATLAVGSSQWLAVTMPALLIAGGAWVLMLSTFNITVQLSVPRWVVGRAMAVYQALTFGGMAAGSWAWGLLAHEYGLPASLSVAGVLLAGSILLGLRFPLLRTEGADLEPSLAWDDPEVALDLRPQSGPVVVTVEYHVDPADRGSFLGAMQDLRRIRRRDGARRWSLLQDVADPAIWIERFQSPTWLDHLRQHHRVTRADRAIEMRATAFHRGPAPPKVRHFVDRPPEALTSADGSRPPEPAHPLLTDPALPPTAGAVGPAAPRS